MVLKRSLLIVLLLSLALVSPCLAKGGKGVATKITPVAQAVIEEHNKALNAQDIKGVMNTYSDDPNCVLMGTGPGESYVGDEAIGGAYDQIFTRFEANSLSFKYDWIATGSKGGLAWFAVTTTMEGTVNKEKRERTFNMSGALQKEKGKWRIVSLHFSRLGAE
jgi:ketosteroid isomerase-like protein